MAPDSKPQKSRGARTRKDHASERVKTSVLLSRSVFIKVGALAGIRGVDKSTLINSLLEEATRGVVVSLRGPFAAEGAGEGGRQPKEDEGAGEIG